MEVVCFVIKAYRRSASLSEISALYQWQSNLAGHFPSAAGEKPVELTFASFGYLRKAKRAIAARVNKTHG